MTEKTHIALTMNLDERQEISDLMDGRLIGSVFGNAVDRVAAHPEGIEVWHRYHLIGDVLCGVADTSVGREENFVNNLRARLALEPNVPRTSEAIGPLVNAKLTAKAGQSANDSAFRWRMVAAMASLTAVLAIGWNMVGGSQTENGARMAALTGGQKEQKVLAVGVSSAASNTGPQVMLRDPHLDALMAAHKQFGGTSALQMPAGFIRNATFESDSK